MYLLFCILCFLFIAGYIWAEDKEHCEEYGRMLQADPSKVSPRAKKRGLPQVCKKLFGSIIKHWSGFHNHLIRF